jgi:TonB family protein
MLEERSQPELNLAALESPAQKHRSQMLFALVLLLTALILVILKYQEFWLPVLSFHSMQVSSNTTSSAADNTPSTTTSKAKVTKAKAHARSTAHLTKTQAETAAADEITQRTLLPLLHVDVTYGDGRHQTIQTHNAPVNLEFPSDDTDETTPLAVTAQDPQVHLSSETIKAVSHAVDPDYPALAKQMNVQGSVLLQVRIGREGNIEDVQVVSGPDILSAAAVQAVKQWHFKPYFQEGRAVETEAHITVNFNISAQN